MGLDFTTEHTRVAGRYADDPNSDWTVLLNGEIVGRFLYCDTGATGTHHWAWSTVTYPAGNGAEATPEAAREELRQFVISQIEGDMLQRGGSYSHIEIAR